MNNVVLVTLLGFLVWEDLIQKKPAGLFFGNISFGNSLNIKYFSLALVYLA